MHAATPALATAVLATQVRWGLDTRAHLSEVYRACGSDAGVTSIVHQEIYRLEGNPGADDPG